MSTPEEDVADLCRAEKPLTGRRALRAEVQSTWATYTPRVPGQPFRKKDIEDADEIERAESARAAQFVADRMHDMADRASAMASALPRKLIAQGSK